MAKQQRDAAKEQRWRELVTQWQASGVSAREFCAQRQVTEASFYSWRRELQRRAAPGMASPVFVPVTVAPAAAVEVRCPSGHVVTLPNANVETLRHLFAALAREASC
jgi:transposase-like protein